MSQIYDAAQHQQTAELSIQTEEQSNRDIVRIPTPPKDWEYRCLLQIVGAAMTPEDVNMATSLFKGEIGRNLTERISTGIELFDILERRGFLNMNNLLYLQCVLFYINRMDLFEKVAKYAAGKLYHSVYFQEPPDQPAPGHDFVEFHVQCETLGYTTASLEELRTKVARIMGVLPQQIHIAGVHPSASISITLMISKEKALDLSVCRNDLASNGIDKIRLDEREIPISGIDEYEHLPTRQHLQLNDLHEELKKSKKNLEKTEIEVLDLTQELETAKAKLSELLNLNETTQKYKEDLYKLETEIRHLKQSLYKSDNVIKDLKKELEDANEKQGSQKNELVRKEMEITEFSELFESLRVNISSIGRKLRSQKEVGTGTHCDS